MRRRASILIGLVWCVALLSALVIGTLHTAQMDLAVVKNHGDRIQAHYLALAGIEKAKALLYHDARERTRSRTSHRGDLENAPGHFRDVPLGRGQFRVFHGDGSAGGRVYGVQDEESRLSLNQASAEELQRIQGMTPELLAAILDWRDGDNTVSPGGAEIEYYSSLVPPRRPRNGPFQTLRELLMVRGVGSDMLQSVDPSRNWGALFTVDSSVANVNAAGEARVNVQTADQSALTGIRGITPEIASAIVSYREQNRLESLDDLLNVVPQNRTQGPGSPQAPLDNILNAVPQSRAQGASVPQAGAGSRPTGAGGPARTAAQAPGNRGGQPVISQELLRDIADDITVVDEPQLAGVVNVNTASLEVLACLPGLDRDLAQAIIRFRSSNGFLSNVAELLQVPGINRDIFKRLAPRVTARSETYRILSEGRISSTGTRKRIQAIVRVDFSSAQTLSYREDDL